MKRVIAIIITVLLLICSVGCTAGDKETVQKYEYTETYLRVMEPYGYSFIMNGNMQESVVNEHTYQFTPDISEEKRNEFISAQERLCSYLEDKGVSCSDVTLRIISDYQNRTESENSTAYFGIDTVKTWEQVLTTIQLSMGDYTNYGYLYALANYTAKELGWKTDTESTSDVQTLSENTELLNLVYPCFNEVYTEPENISACKALATEILSKIEDPYAGEQAFIEEIKAYAAEKGIEFTPTYLVFAYNSESCPMKFRTKYIEIFRDSTYEADRRYVMGKIDEDYLATTETIIKTFEWLDEQLERFCGKFKVDAPEIISVQLMSELPRNLLSQYFEYGGIYYRTDSEKKIYTTTCTVLGHEYVHYLFDLCRGDEIDSAYESWHSEAVAYYFTAEHTVEECLMSSALAETEEIIGKEYKDVSDEVLYLRLVMQADTEYSPKYYLKKQYYGGIAFADYFINVYGEEAFLNSMMHPSKTEEYTGKDLEQIVDEWCADVMNEEVTE